MVYLVHFEQKIYIHNNDVNSMKTYDIYTQICNKKLIQKKLWNKTYNLRNLTKNA